jgi:hypothetical protein
LIAALLAAAAVAAAPSEEPPVPVPADAHRIAAKVSGWGARPATGRREARAHRLMARVFRRAELRVDVQELRVPGLGRSRNVIGVLDTPRTCLRIVMAHTDSTPNAPGANDNASGLGVVASLAGRLRLIDPWCDVWVVATGAEERVYTGSPDHLGALALAKRARAHGARERLRWALSLDEVGTSAGRRLRSPVAAPRRGVERRLLREARRAGARLDWQRDSGSGNSDHRELELAGRPAMKLGGLDNPCRHAACDAPQRLRKGAFRAVLRLLGRVL